ncbi:hypothetical protein BABINDRAFT_161747 [Babjeviella inositovora NRRL Y-12698]|uniref:Mitochondrial inner membrane protease subunit n=1 Tax=Babjeviella inositovora NRRL Y-12698 TaxID=984486 RepID=A0A1E3QNQ3_9ASCO|nr:uncharacterized protein BABINDRAFT_161747 [Babjeviella inositovora NRRL Y-12698]ODQ79339.1 hypothetical protein BABINDRAFT_161747 [Babjeviella inositovora NRRL Y-12698]
MASKFQFVANTLSLTLKVGCTIHLFQEYVYEFCETKGESMLPTILTSFDFVHCDKTYRHGRNLVMGDCVVACKPTDPEHRVCKRITGMPGSIIQIDPLSGSELTNVESSLDKEAFNKYIRIPEGHVWVTGDNLCHSLDSRSYSMMPLGLVKGKIVAAQDFSKSFWGDEGGIGFWGFRWIKNNFVEEPWEE